MGEGAERKDRDAATVKERAAEKKRIRLAALARRDDLAAEERRNYSGRIVKNLTSLPCYREADALLTYISFRSEVDTFPLTERAFADGKAVFAPKVLGKEMDFYRIFSVDDLEAGYRGILEPAGGQTIEEWMIDRESQRPILICMPGAAFDRARHRVGYGGGFYDRYVSRFLQHGADTDAAVQPQAGADSAGHLQRKVTTAALAYDCQVFEKIPWETHDICPMCVVTEKEILREQKGTSEY